MPNQNPTSFDVEIFLATVGPGHSVTTIRMERLFSLREIAPMMSSTSVKERSKSLSYRNGERKP